MANVFEVLGSIKRLAILVLISLAITLSLDNFALASSPMFQAISATPSRTTSATPTLSATLVTASRTVTSTPTLTTTLTVTSTATRRITATPTLTASLTVPTTPTISPAQTITPTLTVTLTATPTLTTTTGTPTPAPIRYAERLSVDANVLSIDALRARAYGGSGIKITRTVLTTEAYRQVLIEYPSDGLRITGVMNIPRGAGPFPVVLLNHGYFKPAEYKPGDGTSKAADAFARRGYLTIASDYRCYAGSQCAANPLYVGYAIDVLNLIAQLSSISDADTSRVGVWGHSMGGGITIRVLAINDSIKVASFYGSLSADDEIHYCWLIGCKPRTPVAHNSRYVPYGEADPDFVQPSLFVDGVSSVRLHELFLKTSASRHLANVTAAVILHHGEFDDIVPIEWSVDLASSLSALGRTVVLHTYPGEGHVFAGWGWQLFMTRTLAFFDEYLKPRDAIITVDKRILQRERVAADSSY